MIKCIVLFFVIVLVVLRFCIDDTDDHDPPGDIP